MTYAAILEVRISHSYYEDARCRSLALVPSPSTAVTLRKHRCQLRAGAGSLIISADLGADGAPLLPLPAGTSLQFSMAPTSEDYVHITDLSAILATPNPLFSNSNLAAGTMNLELISNTSSGSGRGANSVADVEIIFAGNVAGQSPSLVTFVVPLEAKSIYWVFYCLTDLVNAETELHIVDEAPSPEPVLSFRDEDRRKLNDAPDPSDPVGSHIVLQGEGLTCVRFISSEPVVLQEKPRRYLALRIGNEKLSSPLPNPSIQRPSRMDLPMGTGTTETREVLTQLIEYHNYLTQTPN